MGVIKVHHTKVDMTSSWDGPGEVAKLSTPITASVANGMFAYFESQGAPDDNNDGYPDTKAAYKFPHHNVVDGVPGDANLRGVNAAMQRIGQADIPASNIPGIKEHLRAHQEDAKAAGLGRAVSVISDLIEWVKEFAGVKRSVSLFDIGQYAQEQLNAQAPQPSAPGEQPDEYNVDYQTNFVLDVRADENGISVIATKSDGKMYKAPVTVGADNSITIGEYSEVQIEYTPTAREITIKRQADGRVRWLALPACTAVLNRSGEIDSRALFRSFEEYAKRTGEYPKLDFYHKGEKLILGQGDQVAAIGYGYCVTGLFDETDIARAAIKALEDDPNYWGTSIAYIPTAEPEVMRSVDGGADINVYNAGINPYVSLLPEKRAASIMTSIGTSEGVKRMTKDEEEALKKLTGGDEELFNKSKLKLDFIDRTVEDNNMIRRDDGSAPDEGAHDTPASEPTQPVASELRAMTPDDMMAILNSPDFENKVTEIVKKLQAAEPVPAQMDAVTPAPVVDNAQAELRTAVEALTARFETLRASVADLAKEPEQIARELLDDMPAKFVNQRPIIRARNAPPPADLKAKKPNLAEVAESGLAKLRQQKEAAQ